MREGRIARVVGFQGVLDRNPDRDPLMQVALALEGVWGRRRLAASPN